jgi:MFS family permease
MEGGLMVFEELRAYPRAFKVLFVSALIENTAFGLIIPFLTLYMKNDIKIDEVLIGVVLMGYTLSGIPAMIVGGVLADKIGRRTVLLSSLGLMSLTILMYFFAFDFYSLFAIALVDSFVGTMYMPAANAMIADVIPSGQRPKAFSTLRIGWNVGIVFGPVVGAIIVAASSMKVLFVFGAAILFSAFIMNLVFIPETKPKDTGEEITFKKVLAVASDRPFFLLCALTCVFWFFFSQWMSVLPLYSTEELGIQQYEFGLLFAVSAIMVVFLQIPVTSKTELRRRSAVLLLGQFVGSLGFGLIFLAWDFISLLACIVVITIGELVYMSIVSALIADLSPEARRGIYMGFSGFVQTLGSGVGFFFGMWLFDTMAAKQYIWLVFSSIGLITLVGYLPLAKMIGPERDGPCKHSQHIPLAALPLEK